MQEPDLPYPVPEPHEIINEAPPGVVAAVLEADADIAAGRFIRCESEEAFDALFAEFVARHHPQESRLLSTDARSPLPRRRPA